MAGPDSTLALVTFYNYVSAWILAFEREYETGNNAKQGFLLRLESLPAFNRLEGGGQCSDELISAFRRAKLTLYAMQKLPIDAFPDLAPTANFWLPVQAYYVVHSMGIAVLNALGQQVPREHRPLRASFSRFISRLLPFPFFALCAGGPEVQDFSFQGIDTSPQRVASQSNLAKPQYSEGHDFIGKILSTTRDHFLEEQFVQARQRDVNKGRKRRNLRPEERNRLAQRLHDTSILDFLYRMRIRSNYEDPDMYFAAFDDVEGAVAHYRALTYLSDVLVEGLCTIIRRKLGRQTMERLEIRLQ